MLVQPSLHSDHPEDSSQAQGQGAIAPEVSKRSFLQQLIGETRTRIFLLYGTIMLAVTGLAVPIFRAALFADVDARVRADMAEEMVEFEEEYEVWREVNPHTEDSLTAFIGEWIQDEVPEDDNYHLFILEGELYRANPSRLPSIINANSELVQTWLTLSQGERGKVFEDEQPTSVGNAVLYKAFPLDSDDAQDEDIAGIFVIAHFTEGERQESLAAVTVFVNVAAGVVLVSFVVAWLLSQQLLKPVKQLAMATRSISETDLTQRLPVEGKGELADLSKTFNGMMDRLESAFISQRNFVNDAGHELRTPITIIQGHLDLMGDSPEEREETLDIVQDELERMTRFVNDLVLLAKAERPDFLHLETIDVKELTGNLFTKATTLAPRQWRLSAVGQGTLVGDRQRITGAILNLAQNATQHTQESDTIELGSVIEEGEARFWVRDTGSGIAVQDQSRIFDRFARAANRYRQSEGAGLGLSIVKAIAESHGGRVHLTSQLDAGSTFTLILPLDPPQERPVL
jgi:signal transduction histidine kinase